MYYELCNTYHLESSAQRMRISFSWKETKSCVLFQDIVEEVAEQIRKVVLADNVTQAVQSTSDAGGSDNHEQTTPMTNEDVDFAFNTNGTAEMERAASTELEQNEVPRCLTARNEVAADTDAVRPDEKIEEEATSKLVLIGQSQTEGGSNDELVLDYGKSVEAKSTVHKLTAVSDGSCYTMA